jgi:hypothetical protein
MRKVIAKGEDPQISLEYTCFLIMQRVAKLRKLIEVRGRFIVMG